MKRTAIMMLLALAFCMMLLALVACTENAPAVSTNSVTTTAPSSTTEDNTVTTTVAPVTTPAVTTPAVTTKPAVTTTAARFEVVSGKFTESKTNIVSQGTSNNLAIYGNLDQGGEFAVTVTAGHQRKVGIVFGYSKVDGVESYYRLVSHKESQQVIVEKVVGNQVTVLYTNYLSADYRYDTSSCVFKVIVNDKKAYCYFRSNLYTVVDMELEGTGVGIYSQAKNSYFRSEKIDTEVKEPVKVDTLIFGHSYMEWWSMWAKDVKPLVEEFDAGEVLNIGIGGSVASHWDKFKEGLVEYKPDTVIYYIGINDLTGGTSPTKVVNTIKSTLLYMKEALPELKVVLCAVNHCPARSNIKVAITETNVLMRELCASYDWIMYADLENSFNGANGEADATLFRDGLHPIPNAYKTIIVPAIASALRGENQPSLDPDMVNKLLGDAKAIKYCLINDYSEKAYKSAEWTEAKPIYDEAVAAIEACKTADEVKALDLSSYIARLSKIKSLTDYIYEELVGDIGCSKWEVAALTNKINSSTNGAISLYHDGHRTLNTYQFTDMSFTFKLDNITAEFPTVGILVRAKQLDNTLGMEGYYINIVTEPNYIQIWYFNNSYSQSGTNVTTYIGGWVFPEEVEGTEFRVVVKGDKIYIYTEESYINEGPESYGCSADLSYKGAYDVYEQGGIGVMAWSSGTGANGTLTIDKISGTYTEKK